MTPFHDSDGSAVGHLATFLSDRKQTLLDNWHKACMDDVSLKGPLSLNRKNFVNNLPAMLDVLGCRMNGQADQADLDALTAEHGLHRWQKGYTLSDLSSEMQHLGRVLLSEFRAFWKTQAIADASQIAFSYEQLSEFRSQINTGSIIKYADLQRQSALSRIQALKRALSELSEIGKQRTDLLRHSSHDLRGSFGALQGAAALLEVVIDSDEERKRLLEIIHRNLSYCHTLLAQLLDLARLEAGQEKVQLTQVDAGKLLTDLVYGYQPLANDRGLLLTAKGPAKLLVECDQVHLHRIVQNLLLNALKHTQSGWISVAWEAIDESHWQIVVQDTGPGLPVDKTSEPRSAINEKDNTAFSQKGEGIGLSIVKGLCELLKASMQITSKPGEGTAFKIMLAIGNIH